jgi:hypothetical protein
MIRTACLAAALLLVSALPSTASAYWGFYGLGFGNPWGYGFNYNTEFVPAPPYFSVYPPVYYSPHITARHYGASPYAWMPGMEPITYVSQAAVMPAPQPLMIENPYVTGAKQARAESRREAAPVGIENPYVTRR